MEGVKTRSQAVKNVDLQENLQTEEAMGDFQGVEQPQQSTSDREYQESQSQFQRRYSGEFNGEIEERRSGSRPAYHQSPPQAGYRMEDSRNFRRDRMAFKLNLPHYDGQGKWITFIRQFEAITSSWSDDERLQHMLPCLRGEAADFAFELDQRILDEYDLLVEELHKRFQTKETRQTKVRKFYNRKLQRGETLRQYAGDLKCLIRKAYPNGLSRHIMEEMLLKQFFDGLEDEDLRYYVEYLKNPDNLDEAVELVYEYDEYRNIKRETLQKKGRGFNTERRFKNSKDEVKIIGNKSTSPPSNQGVTQTRPKPRQVEENEAEANKNGSLEKVEAKLQDLTKVIGELTQLLKDSSPKNKASSNIKDKECFICSEKGHFANKCPNKTKKIRQIEDDDSDISEVEEKEEVDQDLN